MTELREILVWVTTAGAGVLAYWLVEEIEWLARLSPKAKRFASFGLTAAIALAAWGIQLAMAYVQAPVGWRAWVEAIVSIAAASIVVAQGVHGVRDLPPVRH